MVVAASSCRGDFIGWMRETHQGLVKADWCKRVLKTLWHGESLGNWVWLTLTGPSAALKHLYRNLITNLTHPYSILWGRESTGYLDFLNSIYFKHGNIFHQHQLFFCYPVYELGFNLNTWECLSWNSANVPSVVWLLSTKAFQWLPHPGSICLWEGSPGGSAV